MGRLDLLRLCSPCTSVPPSSSFACRPAATRQSSGAATMGSSTNGTPPQRLQLLPASPLFFSPISGSGRGMAPAGCASPQSAAKGSAPGRRP
jgi:hypothetical protein